MKAIFLILFLIGSVFAVELNWLHDFEEAKKVAKQKNLPIMIMYTTQSCPECEYMKKKVFQDEQISRKLEVSFVLVLLDIHKDKLPFEFIGVPTFFFTKPDGTLIDKKVGGSREKAFLAKLAEVTSK